MENYIIAGIETKMQFAPSTEQVMAAQALIYGNSNIVLSAKAGAGKTTTIQILTDILLKSDPTAKILMIAFNKSIVEELKQRMDGRIHVKTSHSLGMSVLNADAALRGKKVNLNNDKARNAIRELIKTWEWDMDLEANQEKAQNIKKLCNLGRLNLCKTAKDIEEIAEKHGIDIIADEANRTLFLIETMRKEANIIDFVDMIYLPCVKADKLNFPKYDYVFIDECQDLTAAQQFLMTNCLKSTGRFIAVGDPAQAIYGFMGADADSFKNLQEIKNTVTLPLNKCYRCTKAIIEYVREKTGSEIVAFEGNAEGVAPREGSVKELQDGDFVMCRNTYPLVKLCFELLSEGKAATIKGRDIGANLQNIITQSKRSTLQALFIWMQKDMVKKYQKLQKSEPQMGMAEIKDLPAYTMQQEKYDIIRLIANNNGNVRNCEQLKWKIKELFTDTKKGGILLSTVHKSKGLEFDRCFVIERNLMPSAKAKLDWQIEQENNIQYVCYTRAKKDLIFIEDWTAGDGYQARITEAPSSRPASTHVGTVGEKTPMECKIIDTMEQEGKWGPYTLYEMEDQNGNIIVKFGEIAEKYFTDEKNVRFNAEVKQHKEFRGEKKTIIGRLAKYKK